MGKFYSTKTYGNDRGLSCAFRQWRAPSHCSLIHGYSIGIKLTFGCEKLAERNWVQDFGGLKEFKNWAEDLFDHTFLVAADDPELETFKALPESVCNLRIVPDVGCERFAELCYFKMADILLMAEKNKTSLNPTVYVKSVEVFEHGANSAIYEAS